MSLPKLSISNLAWSSAEDDEVAVILHAQGVEFIDLAMGKYFESPSDATIADWIKVKETWANRGIAIAGMQSLLFGVGNHNLFGSEQERQILSISLSRIFERAESIGVKRLVFGSPSNRRRLTLGNEELETAGEFFRAAGAEAASRGVKLLLEPNSKRYGCNFLNSARQALDFVAEIGEPGLGVNLDLGAQVDADEGLSLSDEDIKLLGHLHLSESDLNPLRAEGTLGILRGSQQLLQHFEFATVEQLGHNDSSNLESVANSLKVAKRALER